MDGKCQNCGKILDDAMLTHCSTKCQFEQFALSQKGYDSYEKN